VSSTPLNHLVWHPVEKYVNIDDQLSMSAAEYAAAVIPLFTFNFDRYVVPQGHSLRIQSVSVGPLYPNGENISDHRYSANVCVVSRHTGASGWADISGATSAQPWESGVVARIEAPGTVVGLHRMLLPGEGLQVRFLGLPWAEPNGFGAGISASFSGELIKGA
jgi:hypothetical protein